MSCFNCKTIDMEQEWIFCVFPDGHTEFLKRDEIPETEGIIKYCYDKTKKNMNEEEYDLLMKDLCGRLPYGVKANVSEWDKEKHEEVNIPKRVFSIDTDGYLVFESNGFCLNYYWIKNCALLLRPLSSMTEEEANEYNRLKDICTYSDADANMWEERYDSVESIDWLNKNMFDYRGLIEKGLALEAPEGMYN